jgi:hypothetical protein
MTWAWGAASGAVTMWSFVPYVRGIRHNPSVRPSPLSWLIWAALYGLLTGSQYARGGRASLALAAAEAAGCSLIFVMAWRRAWAARPSTWWRRGWQILVASAGDAMPPPVTAALLAAVAAALAAWHFAGPALAIALAVAIDATAGAITARKVAAHPASEPLASWWWYGTGAALALPAASPPGGIMYASPAAGLAIATAVIASARLGHQRPPTRQAGTRAAAPAAEVTGATAATTSRHARPGDCAPSSMPRPPATSNQPSATRPQ